MKSRAKRLPTHQEYKCQGKRAYESDRVAKKGAEDSSRRSGLPIYTYKCHLCKSWHLTRSEPRPLRLGLVDQYARRMEKAAQARAKREEKRATTDADLLGS